MYNILETKYGYVIGRQLNTSNWEYWNINGKWERSGFIFSDVDSVLKQLKVLLSPNEILTQDFLSVDYLSLCGWLESEAPFANANMPSHLKQDLKIYGYQQSSRRLMMFEIAKKILGEYPFVITQLRGDCTSMGGYRHPLQYLQLMQMAMGSWDTFKYIFSPYGYGCERVFIGGGGGGGDGGTGAWIAEAVVKYGSLPEDLDGLPKYSASVAGQWGNSSSILQKWTDKGKQHLVKSTAKVTTWDQLVDSICNLYPVDVCSSVGYTMQPQSDGFHHRSGRWDHSMCIIGVDNEYKDPHACIQNSWGPNAHGKVVDFTTGEEWPGGTLRVRKDDIQRMLDADDSFCYSSFDGFPAQIVPGDFSSI